MNNEADTRAPPVPQNECPRCGEVTGTWEARYIEKTKNLCASPEACISALRDRLAALERRFEEHIDRDRGED